MPSPLAPAWSSSSLPVQSKSYHCLTNCHCWSVVVLPGNRQNGSPVTNPNHLAPPRTASPPAPAPLLRTARHRSTPLSASASRSLLVREQD